MFNKNRSPPTFIAIGQHNPGHQLVLAIGSETVADEALVFSELGFKIEGVLPVENNCVGYVTQFKVKCCPRR